MSSPCSIQSCKQSSSIFCYTCNKNLCHEHLKEHDIQLCTRLIPLVDEAKTLSNRYTVLDTKKLINDYRQKLKEWRDDSHKTVDQFYQQKSEQLDQNWSQKMTKPQKDIERINSKLKQFIRNKRTTHEQIHQSTEAINYIQQQLTEIEQKGITMDIRPLSLDSNFISVEESKILDIDVFDPLSPYRTINSSSQSGVTFAGNNKNLLIYEYRHLNLLKGDLISVEQSPWTNGQIYHISWSITLISFIAITDKRTLYLIKEDPLSFTRIQSIPQEKWWSCTCSEKSLYLTTYGTDANIFIFNLLSSFELIKQWRSPDTCKQHECIDDINYTNETLLLTIVDSSNKTVRAELRSSITLRRFWTLSFDIEGTSYQPTIHSSLFKSNEWFIIVENTYHIFHVTQDGKFKKIYKYKLPVWNATPIHSNTIPIRTENNIYFHQILFY